jgi:hypothetical protein
MRGYHQISALPLPALISIDDPNSSLPLEITLQQLSSVAVLMQKAVRTVQQLYPKDMQTLATFPRACNDGVLPVTYIPLPEA